MSRHRAAEDPAEEPADDSVDEPLEPPTDTPATARPRPRPGPTAPVDPATGRRLRGPVLLVAGVLVTALAVVVAVVALRRDDGPAGARSSAPASDAAGLTRPAAAQAFVAGATADITAVTAYDYRSLDIALSSGLAVTTGTYREAYRSAITGSLGDRAKADRIVQTFQQTGAGIGAMADDGRSAKVLIFGVQSVARGSGTPTATPVTLTATIVRQANRYLISKLESGTNAGLPPGTVQLAQAAETARRGTLASLTLRRATLSTDYATAVAATVEPRRSALEVALEAPRGAVQRGRYDLTGRVTAIAVERVVAGAASLLVAATGLRVADGEATIVADARLRVTVVRTTAGWRISDSQPVDG